MPIREHDNFKMKKIIDQFLSKIFLGVGFVGASMAVGAVMDEHMKSEDTDITKFNRALVTIACCTWGFYAIKNMLTLQLIIVKYKKILLQRHNMLVVNNNNLINVAGEIGNIDQNKRKQQNTGSLSLS